MNQPRALELGIASAGKPGSTETPEMSTLHPKGLEPVPCSEGAVGWGTPLVGTQEPLQLSRSLGLGPEDPKPVTSDRSS